MLKQARVSNEASKRRTRGERDTGARRARNRKHARNSILTSPRACFRSPMTYKGDTCLLAKSAYILSKYFVEFLWAKMIGLSTRLFCFCFVSMWLADYWWGNKVCFVFRTTGNNIKDCPHEFVNLFETHWNSSATTSCTRVGNAFCEFFFSLSQTHLSLWGENVDGNDCFFAGLFSVLHAASVQAASLILLTAVDTEPLPWRADRLLNCRRKSSFTNA